MEAETCVVAAKATATTSAAINGDEDDLMGGKVGVLDLSALNVHGATAVNNHKTL